jgi:UDP-N-acetylglucosamine diphosphorylase/glucosamine-1-phosphate N-acetyltransferase
VETINAGVPRPLLRRPGHCTGHLLFPKIAQFGTKRPMRVAFFEDRQGLNFGPIAQLRPVFELLCGHFSVRERTIRTLPVTDWGVFARELLQETYHELHPEAHFNDSAWLRQGPTLLLNGGWLASPQALAEIDPQSVGLVEGQVAHLTVEPSEAELFDTDTWETAIYQIARTRPRAVASGTIVSAPWQLVEHNRRQIEIDFAYRPLRTGWAFDSAQVALIGPVERVSVDRAARIDSFVVLDTSRGPISVEAGAIVQSFTRLEGPCHIATQAQLFRANIRGGTTIGPVCRVGGEIEASILHGYVNKYHDGFLGHSYVCPWVNLGALSTNSDLKNDYSAVRVPLDGRSIDTGLSKVGCFIGDHTKTGLGSLFNTGSSIGVMCMILPGGELLPKHIPSFTAVWHGELADAMPIERSLEAARQAMDRRERELTDAQERLLRQVYEATQFERNEAIERFRAKHDRHSSRAV